MWLNVGSFGVKRKHPPLPSAGINGCSNSIDVNGTIEMATGTTEYWTKSPAYGVNETTTVETLEDHYVRLNLASK